MNIGGKNRPIKVGVNQSILYCRLRDVPINQIDEDIKKIANGTSNGSEIRDLIWAALKDGARKAKQEFEYTPEDVGDWMEDVTKDDIAGFMSELVGTAPKKKSAKKK